MSFYEKLAAQKKLQKLKAYQPQSISKMVLDLSSSKALLEDDLEFRARSQSQSDRQKPHVIIASEDNTMHSSLPNSLDKLTYSQNNNNKPDLLGSAISLAAMPSVEYATHIHSKNMCNNNQPIAKDSKSLDRNPERTDQTPVQSHHKAYNWSIWIKPKVDKK